MTSTRRELLGIAGTAIGAYAVTGGDRLSAAVQNAGRIKAVALDAFTVFDPRSVAAAVEEGFPGRGRELSTTWQMRQFEYCWLRTLDRTYVDFWQVTEEALVFAFKAARIDLQPGVRARLMDAWLALKPWPDSVAALGAMRDAGIRLAWVSNFTPTMLQVNTRTAGADGLFEHFLSTDAVQAFKPDPRAYRMAETAFGLPREQIAFAAFGGWDAAGARSFGLNTFWVNRLDVPMEELGAQPDAAGRTLTELANYVMA
jgi:2-haloacid dehalogenase